MTDRMDYLNPLGNNLVYCLAIEKLAGLEVPERAMVARVILAELTRIASHLVWLGTHALDLGAMSVLLYCFRERERILDMFEMVSGQRMMTSYFRPGGLWRDLPDEFLPTLQTFIDDFPSKIDDYESLLVKNPLWIDRTQGIGVLTPEDAIASAVPVRRCADRASTSICAKRSPTRATRNSTLTYRSANMAMCMIGLWCACSKCASRCRIIQQAHEAPAERCVHFQ